METAYTGAKNAEAVDTKVQEVKSGAEAVSEPIYNILIALAVELCAETRYLVMLCFFSLLVALTYMHYAPASIVEADPYSAVFKPIRIRTTMIDTAALIYTCCLLLVVPSVLLFLLAALLWSEMDWPGFLSRLAMVITLGSLQLLCVPVLYFTRLGTAELPPWHRITLLGSHALGLLLAALVPEGARACSYYPSQQVHSMIHKVYLAVHF